jgi:HlyD family type I secretion membrane fusion protein
MPMINDLSALMDDALANNATFKSAESAYQAEIEKGPQGRSGLLPQISAQQTTYRNNVRVPGQSVPGYSTIGLSLSLSQPLFKWDAWETYQQGKLAVAGAEITLHRAEQDLRLNLSHRQEIVIDAQLVQTAKRSYALSSDQLRTNEQLRSEGFVAETKVQDFRREEANSLTRVQSGAAELLRANQKRTELELKIAGLKNEYVKTASDEFKEANATSRAFQLADAIRPARDINARTQVVAPVAGVIVGSTVHTVGAVIGPRDTLMEVVPSGMPLIIEANIRPDDVRNIEVGGSAEVRLPAYNSRVTPLLKGTVVYIAPDALVDKDARKPIYVARIEVSVQTLASANRLAKKPMVLGPGLRAKVYMQTEARSAMDYMLDPIKDGIRKSMGD